MNLHNLSISDGKVTNFVNSLDIGVLHTIPGSCGVFRTVAALTSRIIDLYLKCAHLRMKLVWYNGIKNHFIFEFSDDGAPESKKESMCIGSLTCWNFGKCVRSRDCHYPIHMITAKEKDDAVFNLWKQYTEEMQILEGNTLTINGERCTIEFQPSADQAWQFWANNELTQAATYPSMYAKVHKSQLTFINGTIGNSSSDIWAPPSKESRANDLKKLDNFREELNLKNLSSEFLHKKELEFMAKNGLRQKGKHV